MPEIEFYAVSHVSRDNLTYVVICARYRNQWVVVRHQDRGSWEIPGGHIEPDESPDEAAARELKEETGSRTAEIKAVCDYSVKSVAGIGYGRLYFAVITEISARLEYEIAEVRFVDDLPEELTYKEIQPVLFNEVRRRLAL